MKTKEIPSKPIGNWILLRQLTWGGCSVGPSAFNQPIDEWNITAVTQMSEIFLGANALSNANKGKIHESFSASHLALQWRQYVVINNSNFQTAVNLWFDSNWYRCERRLRSHQHFQEMSLIGRNMSDAFRGRNNFNEDIGKWNDYQVTTMHSMFFQRLRSTKT